FASSRRAAAASTAVAATARPPPTSAGAADVNSTASAAAATVVVRVVRIAVTLHARALSWNIRLPCSFTPAYRFYGKRPRLDVVSTKGTDLMTRPRFSCEGGGRVAAAMAGVVLACSGTGCGSRGGAN